MDKGIRDRTLATSLIKGLDVLTIVAHHPGGISTKELVKLVNLPRTTVLRILETLNYYGLIRYTGSRYFPTKGFYHWISEDRVGEIARSLKPTMKGIHGDMNELVLLGMLDGTKLRHLSHLESTHAVRVVPDYPIRYDLHTSAMGKLILTQRPDLLKKVDNPRILEEVDAARQDRFAWNLGETTEGIMAIAMWAGRPSPIAPMISVSWPQSRDSDGMRDRALASLKKWIQLSASEA